MNGVTFAPVLPVFVLGIAAAIAISFFVWSTLRSIRSVRTRVIVLTLRILALALLFFVLLQPKLREESTTVLRPQIAVLVDDTESMRDQVDPNQATRADQIKLFQRQSGLKSAQQDFDIRYFRFSQKPSEAPAGLSVLKYDAAGSNISGSALQLMDQLKGQPLAAILLLSDGLDTMDGHPALALAKDEHPPVFAFELEKTFKARAAQKKIELTGVDAPGRAFVNRDVEIKASVTATGMNGQTTTVELWSNGQKIKESTVAFSEDTQTRQATFPVFQTQPGSVSYEVRLPAANPPASLPVVINFLAPGNRILYLQNTLGFDFKFLRKAIVADRNLELSAYVRWSDGKLVSLSSGAGAANQPLDLSRESLQKYAVILLGDLPPDALSSQDYEALRNYVDQGGGLILLGGPNLLASDVLDKTTLREVLPVTVPATYREGNFPVEITDTGLHHPAFGSLFDKVKSFPPLLTANLSPSIAPTAEVLMQTRVGRISYPIVAATRFGKGRVVTIMTDTLWRWRLAAPGWTASMSPYDTFWSQLIDWLMPADQEQPSAERLEVFAARPNFVLGEHPEIQAIYQSALPAAKRPATLALQIKTPDGKSFDYTMQPTRLQTATGGKVDGYRAEVEPNVAGVFKAHASTTVDRRPIEGEFQFTVTKPATEMTGKPIDRNFLRQLAESTGGKFYHMAEWRQWRKDLHYTDQHITRTELKDLWNTPWLLGLILLLIVGEWFARKHGNLP